MGRTGRNRHKKESSSKSCCDENIIHLQKWMNLKHLKIEIGIFNETGRGFRCRERIEAGEVILSIPTHLMLSLDSDSDISHIIKDKDWKPQLSLTLMLLYEKHLWEKSKYFKFLKVLPVNFTNLYFCSDFEIMKLPLWLKDVVLKQKASVKENYENFVGTVRDFEPCPHCSENLLNIFSYNAFIWAWFITNTRSVYYPNEINESSERGMALAPFLDMFNHSDSDHVEVSIDIAKGVYVVEALRPYNKYEEVLMKYGAHSNLTLLLEYGFVIPHNPHDVIPFSLEGILQTCNQFHPAYSNITKLKYKYIQKNNLNVDLYVGRDELSWNLNGLLYILTTGDSELKHLQCKTYSNVFSDEESSLIQEIGTSLLNNKHKELRLDLDRMQSVTNCSPSFQIVKNFIEILIGLITSPGFTKSELS